MNRGRQSASSVSSSLHRQVERDSQKHEQQPTTPTRHRRGVAATLRLGEQLGATLVQFCVQPATLRLTGEALRAPRPLGVSVWHRLFCRFGLIKGFRQSFDLLITLLEERKTDLKRLLCECTSHLRIDHLTEEQIVCITAGRGGQTLFEMMI